MSKFKSLLSAICCFMLMFTFMMPTNVNAMENDTKLEETFLQMLYVAEKSNDITDIDKIDHYKDLANSWIFEDDIKINARDFSFDYAKAKVMETTYDGNKYTSITLPISRGKYSLLSNLTILFDKHDSVVTYTETLITNNGGMFNIDSFVDGNLIESKKTDIKFVNDFEIQKGLDEFHKYAQEMGVGSQNRGIKKIAACIAAVAGINGGVAYLIAGTCIASCPAVPPICAACIGGVCTIGAADIVAVISCFKL